MISSPADRSGLFFCSGTQKIQTLEALAGGFYAGLVILATNFKNNIDDAFARRFQSHIYFPIPSYPERYKLWQQAFPHNAQLHEQIDLSAVARQYELTGAHIMNIVQHACLKALARQEQVIAPHDILDGIKKEFSKEGKVV